MPRVDNMYLYTSKLKRVGLMLSVVTTEKQKQNKAKKPKGTRDSGRCWIGLFPDCGDGIMGV